MMSNEEKYMIKTVKITNFQVQNCSSEYFKTSAFTVSDPPKNKVNFV